MHNHLKFSLPDGYDQQHLLSGLADHYAIKKERPVMKSLSIYDTFDWRLFNKSFVLYKSANRLFLRKLFKNAIVHSAAITSPPVFIWNFPDSELKEQLAPVLKMRALFKLAEGHSRSTGHRILDQNEKTVARLVYEEIRPSRGKNAPVLATIYGCNRLRDTQSIPETWPNTLKQPDSQRVKKKMFTLRRLRQPAKALAVILQN